MRGLMLVAMVMLGIAMACEEVRIKEPGAEIPESSNAQDSTVQENFLNVSEYTIRKGRHYSTGGWFENTKTQALHFKASFDSSAVYRTLDPSNQGDINKLWGLADCNSYHQLNSARFGWRWYENELQIFAYCYVNGERIYKKIGSVELQSYSSYSILFEPNKYIFQLNGERVEMPRHCSGEAEGYKLLPYFGGDEVAPHTVTILIGEQLF